MVDQKDNANMADANNEAQSSSLTHTTGTERGLGIFAGFLLIILSLTMLGQGIPKLPEILKLILPLFFIVTGIILVKRGRGMFFSAVEWAAAGGCAVYLVYYLAITLFNQYPMVAAPLPPTVWMVLVPSSAVLYLLVLLYTIRIVTRLNLGGGVETLMMFGSLLFYIALNPVAHALVTGLVNGQSLDQLLLLVSQASRQHLPLLLEVFNPFLLILTGIFMGQLLSRLIREPGLLVPVGIIASMVDFWSVFWGPMKTSAEIPLGQQVISNIGTATTVAPVVPPEVIKIIPQSSFFKFMLQIAPPPNIGIGDFVFLAFFLTCAYRLGFSVKRTMWGIFTGLFISSFLFAFAGEHVCGLTIPQFGYLPGLPFICGGALLANLPAWRLTRQEWAMSLITALVIAVIFTGISCYQNLNKISPAPDPLSTTFGRQPVEENYPSFTLNFGGGTAIAGAAMAKLNSEVSQKGLTLVGGRFQYTLVDGKQALTECNLIVVDQRKVKSINDIFEFALRSGPINPGSASWKMQVVREWPPINALEILNQNKRYTKQSKKLKMLQNTTGVPLSSFSVIDRVADYLKDLKPAACYYIRVRPNGATLWDNKMKFIKKLPSVAGK